MQARLPSPLVVSVLYFEDRSHHPELAWLRKGMADMLVAKLARNPSLLVVQRERLEEVIREQALQVSGRVADESAVRVGRLTGATLLVTGSMSVVEGRLRLDAQLLGVEQGVVLATAMAEGKVADVPSITDSLLSNVMALLPGSGESIDVEGDSRLWSSAKANQAGETLSRAGNMVQALEEFERAMTANPHDPAPQANYARTMRTLSDAEIMKMNEVEAGGDRERSIAERIVERLATRGIEADIGISRAEARTDGSVTLYVPVRLSLDPETVTAVLNSVRALGGRIEETPGDEGLIEMAWPSHAALNRELAQAIRRPRRIYLRLLSSNGRTIAVYSDFLQWRLSTWVTSIDGERMRLASRTEVSSEGTITGLLPEQATAVSAVKVTVESVPNERATVRVDLSELEPARDGEREIGLPGEPPKRFDSRMDSEDPGVSLRGAIERVWNPPITERSWGRGYLPGNERTAAVILLLAEDDQTVGDEARLARLSGDIGFDKACMEATRAGVRMWREDLAGGWRRWFDMASHTSLAASALPQRRLLKARVHFRLRKEVPHLNLIGAQERAEPLHPLLSIEPHP